MYRHNQETLTGLTNQIIPAVQSRAYSVVSVPLNSTVQNTNDDPRSSFKGITDGLQSYQYVVGSSLQPNRPVDTKRYNSSSIEPKYEPGQTTKLFQHFICHLNTLNISKDIATVVR